MIPQNPLQITLAPGKKVFFASDFHLGVPNAEASAARERKIIAWLDSIAPQAGAVFLLGDIFDFWFEYRHVIPKGFLRFQSKLLALREADIPVIFFTGNHDMWMFDYFTQELGIPIYREPQSLQVGEQRLYIGHGDGLGKGDRHYKFLKKAFANPFLQRCFAALHPAWGMRLATGWSKRSRAQSSKEEETFQGENEWLWQYCKELHQHHPHDVYIFGHRHLVLDLPVGAHSRYINLGEWFSQCAYAHTDGQELVLSRYEEN